MALKITTNNDVNLCKFSGLPLLRSLFLNKMDFRLSFIFDDHFKSYLSNARVVDITFIVTCVLVTSRKITKAQQKGEFYNFN